MVRVKKTQPKGKRTDVARKRFLSTASDASVDVQQWLAIPHHLEPRKHTRHGSNENQARHQPVSVDGQCSR